MLGFVAKAFGTVAAEKAIGSRVQTYGRSLDNETGNRYF